MVHYGVMFSYLNHVNGVAFDCDSCCKRQTIVYLYSWKRTWLGFRSLRPGSANEETPIQAIRVLLSSASNAFRRTACDLHLSAVSVVQLTVGVTGAPAKAGRLLKRKIDWMTSY